MSIRTKLTIMFLAIALIPLLLITAITFKNYKNSLEANRLSQLETLAAFKADKIETYFSVLKNDIGIIQHSYIVKKNLPLLIRLTANPGDPEFLSVKNTLDQGILPHMSAALNLFVITLTDKDGRVVYASDPDRGVKEAFAPLSDIQIKAVQEGRHNIFFSDIFLRAGDGKPAMIITAPVFDLDGVFSGVVAFEVDMAPIYNFIQDVTGLGKTGETLIGKKMGNQVIFLNTLRYDPQAALKRRVTIGDTRSVGIQRAVLEQRGSGRFIDYRGEGAVGAWQYIPSLSWGVVAKIDAVEAFAEVENLRKLVFMILGIIIVLAGIMAFSIAKSVADPIRKLSQAARMIGSGNLDYKAEIALGDEIGQLSKALDLMAQDLKAAFTQQNLAQESLQQASQYARGLIEASLDPLVTISPEGKITDVNEATIKATGISREELIATDFSSYFTEPGKAQAGYQQVFAKGFVTDYPLTIRHKDGKLTDVLYNAVVYKDTRGNVQGVFAAARDVTQQKQASQYARSLIEASLDPLVTISPEGKITDVNEATIKATGISREELIATDFSSYFTEPGKAQAGYQQVFAKGFVTDYPLTIRHKDGKLTDVLYNAVVYKDTRGNVQGVFAAARDVTQQKAAEEELKRHRDHLEALVEERTTEVKLKNLDLLRSNENLEQFAYVASHDLQEPLRVMSSYSQLLEKRYKDKLDQDAKDFIGFIVDAAGRMQKLIIDLLAYSRTGSKDVNKTKVDCNEIMKKVETALSAVIEADNAKVSSDKLPVLLAPEVSFTQLFQNLIGNALKFHSSRPPAIHISARQDGNDWVFSVRDNGIGIEAQYKEKIFQIFQRLHSKQEYPGTGIGLSICKKIVENWGGKIWVESEPGKGSVFYFTIPKERG